MSDHTLRGTFYVEDAATAEAKAAESAADWFGDIPVNIDIDVSEVRNLAGKVMHYEVDYTATPRREG